MVRNLLRKRIMTGSVAIRSASSFTCAYSCDTIPVTTTVATDRRRKRSVRFINPALEIISSYDMSALEDTVCMKQIFCEVVRDGKKETASIVQKFYFKLAYM
ncbi:uncharacterized protein TNCV_936251 [Trichonephila clavipes]|nr:uncharacterized protein TNCV_936251 [Trichonephila clavipes]